MRRRNDLPGRIVQQACWSWPVLLLSQVGSVLTMQTYPWHSEWCCRHFRDDLPLFQRLVLGASTVPTELSDDLLQCLVLGTPDWTRYPRLVVLHRGACPVHQQGVCLRGRLVPVRHQDGQRGPETSDHQVLHGRHKASPHGRRVRGSIPAHPTSASLRASWCKAVSGEEGATGREHLPITPPLLRRIKAVWDSQADDDPDIAMLWAAAVWPFSAS